MEILGLEPDLKIIVEVLPMNSSKHLSIFDGDSRAIGSGACHDFSRDY